MTKEEFELLQQDLLQSGITLVSACVTLQNAASPLFIGVVSACHPLNKKISALELSDELSAIIEKKK